MSTKESQMKLKETSSDIRRAQFDLKLGKDSIKLDVIFYKNNDRVEFDYNVNDENFDVKVIRNLSKSEYAVERFNFSDIYEPKVLDNKTKLLIDIKNELETLDVTKTPLLLNEYFNFNKNMVTNKKDIVYGNTKISKNTNLIKFKAYTKENDNDFCFFYVERNRFYKDTYKPTDVYVKRTSGIEITRK